MHGVIVQLSARREYRLASALLLTSLILFINLPIAVEMSRAWGFADFAIAMSLYVALVILTYFRLRNAGLSIWWLLPMVLTFSVGPKWQLGSWKWGSVAIEPAGLIGLIPVMIGWFVATKGQPQSGSE